MTPNHRFKITEEYAKWTALSATRSGCPLKSKRDVYGLIEQIDFNTIICGSNPVKEIEFHEWHKRNTEKLNGIRSELRIGWATKIINIYLKTTTYIGSIGRPKLVNWIHPPIDSGLWKGISEKYSKETQIIEKTHFKTKIKDIKSYEDYLQIITGIKLIATIERIIPIEIEHLWKGTEY